MSWDWGAGAQERTWEYRNWLMREVKITPPEKVLNERLPEQIVIMDDDSHWEPRPE
jgi:hypothetical protein